MKGNIRHVRHHRHPKHYRHKKHTYTNLLLIAIGLSITVILAKTPAFTSLLLSLGKYSYIGGFIAGLLFVCTPTTTIGALMLVILSKQIPVLPLCLVAGMGAVTADIGMFHIVRDDLLIELEDIYNEMHGRKLSHIFHSRAFRWMLPVLGAIIIASPLPDELGVGLMGISKLSAWRFSLMSWVLNSVGIFTAVSALALMRPA